MYYSICRVDVRASRCRAGAWVVCGRRKTGLLSLMVLVLISWGILANRRGRLNNDILIEDL